MKTKDVITQAVKWCLQNCATLTKWCSCSKKAMS